MNKCKAGLNIGDCNQELCGLKICEANNQNPEILKLTWNKTSDTSDLKKEQRLTYFREYRKKNRDRIRIRQAEHRKQIKTETSESKKIYYAKHKSRIYCMNKLWREKNLDKVRIYQRRYREKYRDKIRAKAKADYPLKRKASVKAYYEAHKHAPYIRNYYKNHKDERKKYYQETRIARLAYQHTWYQKNKAKISTNEPTFSHQLIILGRIILKNIKTKLFRRKEE